MENVYDGVYFSKVASLHRTDCNSTVSYVVETLKILMHLQENLLGGSLSLQFH